MSAALLLSRALTSSASLALICAFISSGDKFCVCVISVTEAAGDAVFLLGAALVVLVFLAGDLLAGLVFSGFFFALLPDWAGLVVLVDVLPAAFGAALLSEVDVFTDGCGFSGVVLIGFCHSSLSLALWLQGNRVKKLH